MVKVATRAPRAVSGQTILILIFVGVLAYVLLSGGNKEKGSGDPSYNSDGAAVPSSAVGSARTIEPGSARSLNSAAPAADPSAPVAPTNFAPNPGRWVDETTDPSRLRRIDLTTKPGIVLKGGKSKRRKSVDFRDEKEPGTPLQMTHPDDMMSGGGTGPVPYEMGTRPRQLAPEPAVPRVIDQHLMESSAKALFDNMNLSREQYQRLQQLEYMAVINHKTPGPKGRIGWKANGKPADERKPEEAKYWDDPNREEWDAVWGCLPTIGVQAALMVEGFMQPGDIEKLTAMMNKRMQGGVKRDKGKSIDAFWARTAQVTDPTTWTARRLCIGWFADTYRCVDRGERMTISHESVNMREGLALVSNGLQWLEAMGTHLFRKRVFSSSGVDLHGLVVRVAIPPTLLPKARPTDRDTFSYELETHIFMWGGPVPEGKDLFRHWARRVGEASAAMLTFGIEIADTLHALGFVDHIATLCDRRRVIFRPGFTAHGVNASKTLGDTSRDPASRAPILRNPKIVIYPDNRFSLLDQAGFTPSIDNAMRQIMLKCYPQVAAITNSRQHQWNDVTVTEANSQFDELQLLAILRVIGPSLERKKDNSGIRSAHTIEQLDFGGFVPLVKVDGEQAGTDIRFYPLSDFEAVSQIVLPYVSPEERKRQQRTHGETASILLDPSYCIQERLEKEVHGTKPQPLTGEPLPFTLEKLLVQVTCSGTEQVAEFRRQLVEQIWSTARRWVKKKLDASGGQNADAIKAQARKDFGEWFDKYLKSVYAVDASKTSEAETMGAAIVGQPLKFLPSELAWPSDLAA